MPPAAAGTSWLTPWLVRFRARQQATAEPGVTILVASGSTEAFVVDEVGGSWGKAQEVPGLAALKAGNNAVVSSVSCASAGNCAAVGTYTVAGDVTIFEAFVVDEVGGSWGKAQEVPGSATLLGGPVRVSDVSCASAGNCAVGVGAFVVDEVGGSWGAPQEVPGFAALNVGAPVWDDGAAGVSSVSCASAGNCSAGGITGMLRATSRRSWWTRSAVRGARHGRCRASPCSTPAGAACWASGLVRCRARRRATAPPGGLPGCFRQRRGVRGGQGRRFVGAAREVPGFAVLNARGGRQLSTGVSSVSCASAGNCSAGGNYWDASDRQQAFVVDKAGGSWGAAREVPGFAVLNVGARNALPAVSSVSCASAGNCSAGGDYEDASDRQQAFVVDKAGGSWGKAQEVPGSAASSTEGLGSAATGVSSVSCASADHCVAGGTYETHFSFSQAFVVGQAPATSTSIMLSAPAVTYGDEQAEKLSVTVMSPYGGTRPAPSLSSPAPPLSAPPLSPPARGAAP